MPLVMPPALQMLAPALQQRACEGRTGGRGVGWRTARWMDCVIWIGPSELRAMLVSYALV